MHFSKVASRDEVLQLETAKQAELIEDAMTTLYRLKTKSERDDLLALVQTIMRHDGGVGKLLPNTSYVVCSSKLVITFVNDTFLRRSSVEWHEIVGKSLYYERDYEGTQIEQLYSMVMETRLVADSLVRYRFRTVGGEFYDGWFVIVVIPLDDGGIGVLSRYSRNREEVVGDLDLSNPEGPKYIQLDI